MKKNLINAALLGLLVVAAPACTFVSCKDYDDDFNKVNNRLDGLEAAKNQINTEITSLKSELQKANEKATALEAKLAEKADKTALDAAVANLNAKIAEVAKLETRIEALEKAKAELTALVNAKVDQAAYDKKVAEIEARLTAAESGVKLATEKANSLEKTLAALNEKVENQQKTLDKYNQKIAALESKDVEVQKQLDALKKTVADEVAALKKDVKALQDAGYQTEAQVDAKIAPVSKKVDELQTALNQLKIAKVTSLNFIPSYYVQGVESIFSAQYNFKPIGKLGKANEQGVVTFAEEGTDAGAGVKSLNFATANYHVNPSNAKVDTDVKNFKFVDLRSQTRAGEEKVTVENVEFDEKTGVLSVDFHDNLPAEVAGEINVVALNYAQKEGETVRMVVSDYARVAKEHFEGLRIGKAISTVDLATTRFKTNDGGLTALKNLAGAARDAQEFTVLNDGTETLLSELVRTYDASTPGAEQELDDNAAAESLLKDAGFHYEYALVKENAADKSTDVFTINPETGAVKVAFDADKPYQHLSKTAAVRVTLVSDKGDVAAVGYYYVRVATPAKSFATVTADNEVKLACDDNSAQPDVVFDLEPVTKYLAKNFGMTEANVWNHVLTNNFTIKTPAGAHDQFTIKDNVATAAPYANRVGKLMRSVNGTKNIVTWSELKEKNVANLRKEGQVLSTVLQVIKKDDPKVVLYFTVEWKPKSVQTMPEVAFSAKPISNLWYDNQNKADEQEQRMHVSIDGHNTFTHDLLKAFVGGVVTAPTLDATKYPTDIKNLASGWKFVAPRVKQAEGTDGKTYMLSVSNDGMKFQAQEMKDGKVLAGAPVADIASITAAGVITYENNPVSKKLLNHAGYNELKDGQTLTARVGYVTTTCGGKKVLKVTDATKKYAEFDVKFIRPLNVNYTGSVVFGDANQASQEAVIDFKNSTSDWRSVTKLEDLKAAYGDLYVGFAPEAEWTTDLNNGDINTQKLIATFNNNFGVSVAATPAGTASAVADFAGYKEYAFGTYPKLQYTTNTANLKQFTIRIPVYIRYHWGEIKSHIDVKVGKTLNQGNARRK